MDLSQADYISNLPEDIIDIILTKLPILDAISTSILSKKWRHRWKTISKLVFDDSCVRSSTDQPNHLVRIITLVLSRHRGPIQKFELSTSLLGSRVRGILSFWISGLSDNDIKELVICSHGVVRFEILSTLFRCKSLHLLRLYRCELNLSPTFNGFEYLKSLTLYEVSMEPGELTYLISTSPLLETLELWYGDGLDLSIDAPNLKVLHLAGQYKAVSLKNVPLLVSMTILVQCPLEEIMQPLENPGCSCFKILDGVPLLEKLQLDFTDYWSIGDRPGKVLATFYHLTFIRLYNVDFENGSQVLVLLQLIKNSPNLKELQISGISYWSDGEEAPALCFEENEFPFNYQINQLEVVVMIEVSGVPHEMEFIKYLLGHSTVLKVMTIRPMCDSTDRKLNMLVKLLQYRRVSPRANVVFLHKS